MRYLIALLLIVSACGEFQGPRGAPGPKGSPGPNGKSCTVSAVAPNSVAPNGGSLISCEDGSQSLILNGSNGAAGTSGTVVAPVKFCPGTPVYPSKFIEYGFCIESSLYAVYSANGGFMAVIPPGYYNSNGINSSCNFTVLANCQIQN